MINSIIILSVLFFQEEAVPVMTGRDAVRYFVECHHTGEIKSLFFNYAPTRHYRPYDLVCVHKNKVSGLELLMFPISAVTLACA